MNKVGPSLPPEEFNRVQNKAGEKKKQIPGDKEKMSPETPTKTMRDIKSTKTPQTSSSKAQSLFKEQVTEPGQRSIKADKRDTQLSQLKVGKNALGYYCQVVNSQDEAIAFLKNSKVPPGSYCVWKSTSDPNQFSAAFKFSDGTIASKRIPFEKVLAREIFKIIRDDYIPKAPIKEQFNYLEKTNMVVDNEEKAKKILKKSDEGDFRVWLDADGHYQLMIKRDDQSLYKTQIQPNTSIFNTVTQLLESSPPSPGENAKPILENLQKTRNKLLKLQKKASDNETKTQILHELNVNELQQTSLARNYGRFSEEDLLEHLEKVGIEYFRVYGDKDPSKINTVELQLAEKFATILDAYDDYFSNHTTTLFNQDYLNVTTETFDDKFNHLEQCLSGVKPFENNLVVLKEVFELLPMPKNQEELDHFLANVKHPETLPKTYKLENEDTLVVVTHPGENVMSVHGTQKFLSGARLQVTDETLVAGDKDNPEAQRVYVRTLAYDPVVDEKTTKESTGKREFIQIHYENWPKENPPDKEIFSVFVDAAKKARPDRHSPPLFLSTPEKNSAAGALIVALNLENQIIKEMDKGRDRDSIELDVEREVLELRLQNPNLISTEQDLKTVYHYLQNRHDTIDKAEKLRAAKHAERVKAKHAKGVKKKVAFTEHSEFSDTKVKKAVKTKTTSDHKTLI